jgi:peptidyl-tRNA hydrolase
MKQVLVVNQALKLPKGKLAAQAAHAAVGAFLAADARAQQAWFQCGMPKIVVFGADADALTRLEAAARSHGIACCLIHDAGRTVVPAGTVTCLGLGPAHEDALERLTGDLKLV